MLDPNKVPIKTYVVQVNTCAYTYNIAHTQLFMHKCMGMYNTYTIFSHLSLTNTIIISCQIITLSHNCNVTESPKTPTHFTLRIQPNDSDTLSLSLSYTYTMTVTVVLVQAYHFLFSTHSQTKVISVLYLWLIHKCFLPHGQSVYLSPWKTQRIL